VAAQHRLFGTLADEWVDLLLVGRKLGFAHNKEMTELGLPWRGIDLPAGAVIASGTGPSREGTVLRYRSLRSRRG